MGGVQHSDLAGGVGVFCKEQLTCPVFFVLGDDAACGAGGPAIFVVKPCQHVFLTAFFHAGSHKGHVLITQIGGGHAGAYVHMGAAHAHFFKYFQLAQQLLLFQLAVPCPERGAAIFTARIAE